MKKFMIILCLLASTLWVSANAFAAEKPEKECTPINAHSVAFLFDRWNDALKTGNPKKVAALYAKDGVLLPTLSTKPRTSQQEILEYFKDFLKLQPSGKIDQRVIRFGSDWASDTGLYTFRIVEDNHPKYIEARYSFVYECIDGQLLIVHQHSSIMPPVREDNKGNP